MAKRKRYFLMKSEPSVYSIDDLEREGVASWDGVRNYQARNIMRDDMRIGDQVLFYHSSAEPPGIAGIAEVSRLAYPDHTQFDPESPYHDPKASPDNPRWLMVDVSFVRKFKVLLELAWLRERRALADMLVLQRGQRLSVMPVTAREWNAVMRLAASKGA